MSIVRYRPLSILHALQDDMNKLFDNPVGAYGGDGSTVATSDWVPHIDIKEDASHFYVYADVPGVEPKDIQVSLENNVLSIKGERKINRETKEDNYSRVERFTGNFCRQFTLPDNIDAKGVKAKGKHGVLELSIPKVEKSQARLIEVEDES